MKRPRKRRRLTETFPIRLEPGDRDRFDRAAVREGKPVTVWARERLKEASA